MKQHLINQPQIQGVIFALSEGESFPVESYMQRLRENHAQVATMSREQVRPLLPLLMAFLESSPSYFRQLLQIGDVRLLLFAIEDGYPVMERLLLLPDYSQEYIVYLYSELALMEDADANLLPHVVEVFTIPAEHAKTLRKDLALRAIYETAFSLNIPFLPHDHIHPIVTAAKRNDLQLAKSFISAGRRTKILHYDKEDGYSVLSSVLEANNLEIMELCLQNEARADVILPNGNSLLEESASYSTEMQMLLLSHGATVAPPILKALHIVFNTMTPTTVNAEALEYLLDAPDDEFQYRHEYNNGYTLYHRCLVADIFIKAVELQNMAVVQLLLDRLQIRATAAQIQKFFEMYKENPYAYLDFSPQQLLAL